MTALSKRRGMHALCRGTHSSTGHNRQWVGNSTLIVCAIHCPISNLIHIRQERSAHAPRSLRSDCFQRLIQPEVDLDVDHHRDRRFAVLHGRLELVLHYCFERLLVQSHAQRSHHARILRIAVRVDDD